jgi:hypothetical protein
MLLEVFIKAVSVNLGICLGTYILKMGLNQIPSVKITYGRLLLIVYGINCIVGSMYFAK